MSDEPEGTTLSTTKTIRQELDDIAGLMSIHRNELLRRMCDDQRTKLAQVKLADLSGTGAGP